MRRWLIDMLLIAGGVVSLVFEPLAIALHSIVGLVFIAIIGPHLWNRRTWIRGTCRAIRHRRRLSARMRWSASQSVLLLVLAVVVTASGLWDWLDVPTTIRWHAISGFILTGVLVRHAWTRRRWLLRRQRTGGNAAHADRHETADIS
jgi:thiosulfate reductase cytochrome b subunit